jgi:aminoglycoside 3-N-acetyltransferase I
MPSPSVAIRRLGAGEVALVRQLNVLFGNSFDDPETYTAEPPGDAYLQSLLASDHVIALVALAGEEVIGGLVAYELPKLRSRRDARPASSRTQFYIYDLAVGAEHRRQRIASSLIEHLREIGARRGAWVIYVQADHGDDPAIALYQKFRVGEQVFHFDIEVEPPCGEPAKV